MNAEQMIMERPLSREQLYRLREEIRLTQEPYIQLLMDLYNVSIPTITIADGVVETRYSPEVESEASQIRLEMMKAVAMTVRYRSEGIGPLDVMKQLRARREGKF